MGSDFEGGEAGGLDLLGFEGDGNVLVKLLTMFGEI